MTLIRNESVGTHARLRNTHTVIACQRSSCQVRRAFDKVTGARPNE